MKALVTGSGGFIAGHLVGRLLADDWEVFATDIKKLDDWWQVHDCENFPGLDLCDALECGDVIWLSRPDIIFHLAAWMGGIGFISNPLAQRKILHDNTVMTLNMLAEAEEHGVERFFFPSSVCVYPPGVTQADHLIGEADAGNIIDLRDTYSKSKLYLEEAVQAYGDAMQVYIARFQNVYGPHGDWTGGKEKAPAALCRKVAEAKLSGNPKVEIWGDGNQVRSPMYVDDCVEGVLRLIETNYHKPVNLGPDEYLSINELVDIIAETAGIEVEKVHVEGPEGSRARQFNHDRLRQVLGWAPSTTIKDGIARLYPWVEEQVCES